MRNRPVFLPLYLPLIGGAVFSAFLLPGGVVVQQETGASLFLSPSGGAFPIGSTFDVSIHLNTNGQFVNAIEVQLKFPANKLQVVSPANAPRSFIDIWATPPSYSNKDGTVTFQGGVHKPGINTDNGIISTVTFRVKDTGSASVKILDDSRVYLADGTGTDVLTKTTGAIYQLVLPPPAGPFITSPTHPDQTQWYRENAAVFRWEKDPEISGFSYALSDSPVEDPDSISEGVRTNASYQNISDGVHYFHIKSLRGGNWGGVTHYGVKIDNTAPADFPVIISPNAYTSTRQPLITFSTTDQTSGVDHYELKVLHLNPESPKSDNSPFFIEVDPPYSEEFNIGKYEVIVRAFDQANNFSEATARLTIANPIFEIIREEGLKIRGTILVPWWIAIIAGLILLLTGLYVLRAMLVLHRRASEALDSGAARHPDIAQKMNVLREKQKEYGASDHNGSIMRALLLAILVGAWLGIFGLFQPVYADTLDQKLEPPIVTSFPKTISNDEILYIGGRASAPEAQIVINLQKIDNGNAFTFTANTDSKGAWFFVFPEFLTGGEYQVWTQLKVDQSTSQPSPELRLTVAPAAIRIGKQHISFQELYFILLMIFATAFFAVMAFALYHYSRFRVKRERLFREVREAEESVRRGFALLRRDIQAELSLVRGLKMSKETGAQEKMREERLLRDLEWANTYIGKEVWDIEEAEKNL